MSNEIRLPTARKPSSWEHYWASSEYKPDDHRAALIRELIGFFCTPTGWQFLQTAKTRFHNVVLLLDWTKLTSAYPSQDLQEAMYHAPLEALSCLGCAVHESLFVHHAQHNLPLPKAVESPAKVLIRLNNHNTSFTPITSIGAAHVGKLVTIRGTVARITPVRPLVTSMQFVCGRCGNGKMVDFPDGRFQFPSSCGVDGCRSRTLAPNRAVATSIDWQRVALQGMPRDERGNEGRVPRQIDVELVNDLVDSCAHGDFVTVTGIVRVLNGDVSSGKRCGDAKKQCLFLPFVEAISVVSTQNNNGSTTTSTQHPIVAHPEGISYLPPNMPGFTEKDLEFIRIFTSTCEGDQFRQIVHSFSPGICGLEMVKAGLVLSLFGGVRKGGNAREETNKNRSKKKQNDENAAGTRVPVRGDIHVLIVGDPGLGKSQLLQAAATAAPRGVYVCGSSTSSAGLTVSVVRDNGEYCFDAGALVLADRGVCCVDEFDKATSEHSAMLGAMEQQEVSVAKAGLIAALPARTTVLAAANPAGGQYNRGKTLMENLKMSPAMLSRFDLVFLLLDKPDVERDLKLTEYIMARSGTAERAAAARTGLLEYHHHHSNNNNNNSNNGATALLLDNNTNTNNNQHPSQHTPSSLKERLKIRTPDDDPLPPQLLRKYIAYARQYLHPVLSPEAISVIKSFYLDLRQRSAADISGPPVTHRQLESLIRLSEARARVELRDYVTAQDAKDAIEVIKETLDGMHIHEMGVVDFTLTGIGPGLRNGNRNGSGGRGFQAERRRFLSALGQHCDRMGTREVQTHELFTIADVIDLNIEDTSGFIERLNDMGDILRKGGGVWVYNNGSGGGGGSSRSALNSNSGNDNNRNTNGSNGNNNDGFGW